MEDYILKIETRKKIFGGERLLGLEAEVEDGRPLLSSSVFSFQFVVIRSSIKEISR